MLAPLEPIDRISAYDTFESLSSLFPAEFEGMSESDRSLIREAQEARIPDNVPWHESASHEVARRYLSRRWAYLERAEFDRDSYD